MDKITALVEFLKKKNSPTKENAPEGICPNCWGRQEYGGDFFEVSKNHDADINTANPNIGWVTDYANKHLSHFELKEKDSNLVCEQCKLIYHKK